MLHSLRTAAATFLVLGFAAALGSSHEAQAEVSFRGKTITIIVGSSPGGGTDATGRIIAVFLHKYLPGEPSVVVQNMPGAAGIPSFNFLVRKTQPNGQFISMGSESVIDPAIYRISPNVQYDPKRLLIIGGVVRGGTIIVVRSDSQARLFDKSSSQQPVVGSVEAVPRADMQPILWSIEYLGWNAKWVTGYSGTNDVMLAFDRGEVDLTATSNIFQIQERLKSGGLTILSQTGTVKNGHAVGRPELDHVPLFTEQIEEKITNGAARKAFDYWKALNSADKFLALTPDTPAEIVGAYREAFRKTSEDPSFIEAGARLSEGFGPISGEEYQSLLNVLVDTPQEALDYLKRLMRKQGLRVR
jgi:tripartite-type tricarboxylate transporter receptor subunit TctC